MSLFTLKLEVNGGAEFFACLEQAKAMAKTFNICVEFTHTYVSLLRENDDGSVFVSPNGNTVY